MNRSLSACAAVLAAAIIVLAGCGATPSSTELRLKELGKDEKATIKVMNLQDERGFYQQYGALFSAKFPNIDTEVISTQGVIKYEPGVDMNKEYEKFIDEKKPDVLLLTIDLYEKLAESGRLLELDSVIKQDKFDIGGILPAVLDNIKSRSGNKLYGLAPSFNGNVLYYNKKMFEKYGIPLPKDQMSWEDVFGLARRFPTSGDEPSRIYGFGMNTNSDSYFQLVRMIGETKGLSFVDPENDRVTIHTEPWKQAAQLAMDGLKSGAIYRPSPDKLFRGGQIEDYYKADPFMGSKAAMIVNGYYLIDNLKQAKSYLKEQMPDWDVVTVPVDPQYPEGTGGVSVGQVFAVSAQSQNLRAAWEFVKYVNDNEFARVTSKSPSGNGGMLSRVQYINNSEGRNLAAFYKLKGNQATLYKGFSKLPLTFQQKFIPIFDQELKSVFEGNKTIDDALMTIQQKGQEELTRGRQAEEKK